jgi:N-acetylglutamate synthase-like GNAT family acetyltransferase
MFKGGGYLYGLAVQRESQHRGVGSALTSARLDLIRESSQELAVVLAMFWNVGFFYKLGFRGVRRDQLPSFVRRLADFRNPLYKHSAVLWRSLES